jgi:hypothetical protein
MEFDMEVGIPIFNTFHFENIFPISMNFELFKDFW